MGWSGWLILNCFEHAGEFDDCIALHTGWRPFDLGDDPAQQVRGGEQFGILAIIRAFSSLLA